MTILKFLFQVYSLSACMASISSQTDTIITELSDSCATFIQMKIFMPTIQTMLLLILCQQLSMRIEYQLLAIRIGFKFYLIPKVCKLAYVLCCTLNVKQPKISTLRTFVCKEMTAQNLHTQTGSCMVVSIR